MTNCNELSVICFQVLKNWLYFWFLGGSLCFSKDTWIKGFHVLMEKACVFGADVGSFSRLSSFPKVRELYSIPLLLLLLK